MKIKPFFRWYDLWMGIYIDIKNEAVYICPFPMIGVRIQFPMVINYKRWQAFLTNRIAFKKGVWPSGRYQVMAWWKIGPLFIRRYVSLGNENECD